MNVPGIPHEPEPAIGNPTAAFVRAFIIPAAMSLLPVRLNSPEARALLMTIFLQESRFTHRKQIGGPARGFPQFEVSGIRGVLNHEASKPLLMPVLATLRYEPGECYEAIAHNDVLACVFARLLLWTHPKPLPSDADRAWLYYIGTWRPGKPHRETWDSFYEQSAAVEGVL